MSNDRLTIAGREFKSRLWVGTGKYKDFVETQKAIEVSGADVVTVAVRRVNITDRNSENLLDYIDPKKYPKDHINAILRDPGNACQCKQGMV